MEKKNENGKVQLKGQLKLYIQWPAIMALLLITDIASATGATPSVW